MLSGGSCFYSPIASSRRQRDSLLPRWVESTSTQVAFFWTRRAYFESRSRKEIPTIPCTILTTRGQVLSVLCCAAAISYCHTEAGDAFFCDYVEVC